MASVEIAARFGNFLLTDKGLTILNVVGFGLLVGAALLK